MDTIKMGKMISELRKKQGLTQQQLADKLNLSNKTISKWETGSGCPDISNLSILAETLGISMDELIKGEFKKKEVEQKNTICERYLRIKEKNQRAVIVLSASIGAVLGILAYNFKWLG